MITASASAKTILFGEHAVVYGYPAIAIPISSHRATASISKSNERTSGVHIIAPDVDKILKLDKLQRTQLDDALALTVHLVLNLFNISEQPPFDITVHSDIPPASGLGSGAAVSTAIAKAMIEALQKTISKEALNNLIYEVEKIHHGTPSGIDNTVIVYEQPIYFVRERPIEALEIGKVLHLLVADTGRAAPTKIAVDDVRKLFMTNQVHIQPILEEIAEISVQGRRALEQGNTEELGRLMTRNHELLRRLTVSSDELDVLVNTAIQAGALGAKLSGGGRGGNMIAVVSPDNQDSVQSALESAGAVRVLKTTLTPKL